MNTLKQKNMMATYAGFTGPETVNDILSEISDTLKDELTGRQLGLVMQAVNAGHQSGKTQGDMELTQHIGLPNNVGLWDVMGDSYQRNTSPRDCQILKFEDGLNIEDVLEQRGRQVAKWKEGEFLD